MKLLGIALNVAAFALAAVLYILWANFHADRAVNSAFTLPEQGIRLSSDPIIFRSTPTPDMDKTDPETQ